MEKTLQVINKLEDGGIIQGKTLQGIPQIIELLGILRVHPAEHHRLRFTVTGKGGISPV